MTWSIVAHEPATGAFAVAIATRAFAAPGKRESPSSCSGSLSAASSAREASAKRAPD